MKKCNCGSCSIDSGAAVITEPPACSCGQDHHDHQHNDEHGHSHGETGSCGCGSGEQQLSTMRQDIISVIAAVLLGAGSFLLPVGLPRAIMLLAAIVVGGLPILLEGIKSIFRLRLEEMALMTIAVVAACIIGEYFEALIVVVLFRIGGVLEDLAVARGNREVEAVTKIIPENANLLLADGSTQVVPAKALEQGSHILVKSGERLPVDAVVISGSSSVDASSLTGESVAREVYPGDVVLSGMINLGGVLTCETTSGFADSTASKIIEMVKESAANKGRTEKLISRFARVYTPIVIALAVLVAVVPPLLGLGEFSLWLGRSLVFLVASCPCALVISVPLSFFAGVGALSKQGVLVKGTKYLETLAGAKAVVFDKTGTLTTGRLEVSGVDAVEGVSRDEVLALAAMLESYSNHPIAQAVATAAGGVDTARVESCREVTSYGMEAVVDGETVLCGSGRFMEREGLSTAGLPAANVYVAKGGRVIGAVSVFDRPRPEAKEMVEQLRALGVEHTAMLTGDSRAAAEKVQALTGITRVEADLLPGDKVERFSEIRATAGGPTLFVGDGINDSPVLAVADAGVAVGLAADAAMEAADVVLLSDKLTSLPQAIRISRRTGRLARFNVLFALLVKLSVFVLAVLGLANMGMAVFADVGVTVLAVLNATRALRFTGGAGKAL